MKIKSLELKSGQEINLNKISVLVGANNVGKSQTLRDIQQRMENGLIGKFILLEKINFDMPINYEDLYSGLKITDSQHNIGYKTLQGIKSNLRELGTVDIHLENNKQQFESRNYDFFYRSISKFRVSHLDASSRLQLVSTTPSFNPDQENPQNVLQHLFIEKENELLLKSAFKDAFSMDILLDYSALKELCLRIAKEFPEIPADPRNAYQITKDFYKIDDQGDGFRSFVGIILSILFSKDRIILLDEPEAFLHPAQARFLGKWIADNADLLQGQLIIATHNASFLSGILSSNKSIDIFRLNRNENETTFNLIPPMATEKLVKSPMLSSQRILEAIFHKGIIVCEADADRIVYNTVSKEIYSNQEILFVHSHNKQTLKDVALLLKDAKIPVAVVVDIDLLNSKKDFNDLLVVFAQNNDIDELLIKRGQIADSINQLNEFEVLNGIKEDIRMFMLQLDNDEHTLEGAKGAINRIRKGVTKWDIPKKMGINGFPEPIRNEVSNLLEEVKKYNIFIVPVGELEGWIEVETKQKNKWIIKALEEIFKGNSPEELKGFVGEMLDSVCK